MFDTVTHKFRFLDKNKSDDPTNSNTSKNIFFLSGHG